MDYSGRGVEAVACRASGREAFLPVSNPSPWLTDLRGLGLASFFFLGVPASRSESFPGLSLGNRREGVVPIEWEEVSAS